MQEGVSSHNLILTRSKLQHLFQLSAHEYDFQYITMDWGNAKSFIVGVASEERQHA